MDPPRPTDQAGFVLEQVPEMRAKMMRGEASGKRKNFKSMARKQVENYFSPSEKARADDLKRYSEMYSFDTLEVGLK
jgi:hypothetical protein